MSNIIKKVSNKLKNVINGFKHNKRLKQREKVNKYLIETRQTDLNRWKKNNELDELWNERTAILGGYISKQSKIIEFGAGNMFLKTFLNPIDYTPTDIVKRFEETVVCDLNKPIIIDLSKYDTAVLSGVLEYVHNIDAVFEQLEKNHVKQVVLSYCCSDLVSLSRDLNGWLSDLSKSDLQEVFNTYNYKVKDYQEWQNQSIFNLNLNV
ncbi:hypothetical protein [Algibacter pectinivorans]|nr:hypothetical protein [Algibacter pectinivorans]